MKLPLKEVVEVTDKRFEESPLGKTSESKKLDKPTDEYDKPISFGSSAERDELERNLASAKRKLENAGGALEVLLRNKADGMVGVDTGIWVRQNEIADAKSQIRNLEYKLSNLKD